MYSLMMFDGMCVWHMWCVVMMLLKHKDNQCRGAVHSVNSASANQSQSKCHLKAHPLK